LPEKTEQNLQQARGKGKGLDSAPCVVLLLLDPERVCPLHFAAGKVNDARVDALMAIAMPHWC
jgi:hypothetical protein